MSAAPIALLRSYAEVLPRLQAEETLDRAASVALGSGTMKKGQAASMRQRLERQIRGPQWRPKPARPDQLAAMGIRVVRG